MPYSNPSEVPSWVPEKFRPQWMEVWNAEFKKQKAAGKPDKEAEQIAFAAANSVIQKAGAVLGKMSAEQGEDRMTKLEVDGEHPASHYLVVEEPDKPSTWHLRVKDAGGKLDHRLMGAAWAALHGGYRGNKYEGSQKTDAIAKLKGFYKSEGLTVPESASDAAFLERRICPVTELRVEGKHNLSLVGYAAVFNQLSVPVFGFRERIAPGTFKRTLGENPDVRALINHDPNLVLGRTTSGTLEISEDDKGLRTRVELPRTQYALDLAESVRRGDVNQQSFAFRVITDSWSKENGEDIRELRDVDLRDVSVVTFPAYQQTRVEIRSYIKFLQETEEAFIAQAAAKPREISPELEAQHKAYRDRQRQLAG